MHQTWKYCSSGTTTVTIDYDYSKLGDLHGVDELRKRLLKLEARIAAARNEAGAEQMRRSSFAHTLLDNG